MATPLEIELKTYAHNKIGVHLKYEYDRHLNSKWKPYINLMVDAQSEALERQQKALNEAREQIERERQEAFGLAMLALSLVSGPILSWVAGKIEHHWFPKYASSKQLKGREVYIIKKDELFGKDYDIFEKSYDEVAAKVFGDLGSQVLGLGIDKALKVAAPSPMRAANAVQIAVSQPRASFKTNLENALAAEATLTSDAIMSLANSINENVTYGADCLQKLKKTNPRAREPGVTARELEVMAKTMITDDIDAKRREWADKWFYYGHEPGTVHGLAEDIEREIWGLWILNQKLKAVAWEDCSAAGEVLSCVDHQEVESATFGSKGVPESVLRRLADLDVVTARTQLQKLRGITRDGVEEQRLAERKRRYEREDAAANAEFRKAMEAAEGAEDPARERSYLERQRAEAVRKLQEKRAAEMAQDPQKPIAIDGALDTRAEIDALESWAKTHPPKMYAGNMMHTKRAIGSINDIYVR
jgi:hypothetical protein